MGVKTLSSFFPAFNVFGELVLVSTDGPNLAKTLKVLVRRSVVRCKIRAMASFICTFDRGACSKYRIATVLLGPSATTNTKHKAREIH